MNVSVFKTMLLCSSCRSKTSNDRCTAKSVGDTLFCRRHLKVKEPRLWAIVNNVNSHATLIQKVWRGYSLRNWLKLAGPGVLNRSVCHNDEELVTLDDKKSVSPLSYFAFEETGKVYWFDIRSIAEHCLKNTTNPYTRQPMSLETRKRMRKLSAMRYRRKLPNLHDNERQQSVEDAILQNWNSISQIIEENGFFDINPAIFREANRSQLYICLLMISADLKAWASEHKSRYSRRHKYCSWTKTILNQYSPNAHPLKLQFMSSRMILNILNDCVEPYVVCFIIVSSLYRL